MFSKGKLKQTPSYIFKYNQTSNNDSYNYYNFGSYEYGKCAYDNGESLYPTWTFSGNIMWFKGLGDVPNLASSLKEYFDLMPNWNA